MDQKLACVTITKELIGVKALIATDTKGEEFLSKLEECEQINADCRRTKDQRSLKELHTYWAACEFVASMVDDYNWNTSEKVDIQCKIQSKYYTGFTSYTDEHGQTHVQLMLGSISFKEMSHLKGRGYFTEAFNIMAEQINMTVEQLIEATKKEMVSRL